MSLKKWMASSPTRVDLAGGTLDLWPLWAFQGKCTTLNVSINVQTHAELTERADHQVELIIQDLNYHRTFANIDAVLADPSPELRLLKAHLEYWHPSNGFCLKTQSESPVGGGLGGSSSLSMTLIKLMNAWLGPDSGRDLSPYEMVRLAQNLEARVLHVPTGIQDYFPALEGGIHVLEFTALGPIWRRLSFDENIFRERSFLVYTGRPHQSGINNWQVLKEAVEQREGTVEALSGLRAVANDMLAVVEQAQWDRMGAVLRDEYHWRLKLSPIFSSPEIERLHSLSFKAGAEAIKICGAGGGGCVWVWTKPGHKQNVLSAVEQAGFQVMKDVAAIHRVSPVVSQDIVDRVHS